jgi:hypothetical protein
MTQLCELQQQQQQQEWGFLLIDAKNAFNEMWTVWHKWPLGTRFVFNCYKHWASTLMLQSNNGTGTFLYSKEGVTQRDPLSMLAYGIGILQLIRLLKVKFPAVEQSWYADDAGAGSKFAEICHFFSKL